MGTKSGQDVDLYGTSFSIESIKVIAESIGIGNLPDEAAKELADDVSYRVKHVIQDAAKFMHHAKRTKLLNKDVDSALKIKNLEVGVFGSLTYKVVLICAVSSLNMGFIRKIRCLFGLQVAVVESCILLRRKKWI